MAEFSFGGEFVWWPDPAVVEQTNLRRFMRRQGITTLDGLIPRSLDDVSTFWEAVLADLDIQFYRAIPPASPISAAGSSGPSGAWAGR